MRQVYGQTRSYHEKIASERRKRFYVRFFTFLTVGVAIVGTIIYIVFFANLFDIRSVVVDGAENIDVGEIRTQIESLITTNGLLNTQKHVLFFDESNLRERLFNLFPVFDAVTIERNPPHEIIVRIKEREAIGIWCFENNDCSFFDDEGAIWGETIPSSGPLLLNVKDGQIRSPITSNLFSGVMDVYKLLPGAGVGINTIEVRYGLSEDIRVNTKNSWYILMTTTYSILEQINNLRTILDQQDQNFAPEYIDLRIEGRAYYK